MTQPEDEHDEATGYRSSDVPDRKTIESLDPYYQERLLVLATGEANMDEDSPVLALGATPKTWRQLLGFAVGLMGPNGEYTDAGYLTDFEHEYGPCSTAHLAALARHYARLHHLEPTSASVGDEPNIAEVCGDMEFVVLMLGVWPEHPHASLAREVLLPFLAQPEPRLRMMAAISLGHLRDELVLPTLLALLTEGLPEPEPWEVRTETEVRQRWEQFGYASIHQTHMLVRMHLPHILWRWGARSAIPSLRKTLELTARIEQTEARWSRRRRGEWGQEWWVYQYELVRALARFGAFGTLVGVEPPRQEVAQWSREQLLLSEKEVDTSPTHRNELTFRWRAAMCVEATAQHFEKAGRHGTIEAAEVRREVERLLAEQFGLDEEEQQRALEPYFDFQLELKLD